MKSNTLLQIKRLYMSYFSFHQIVSRDAGFVSKLNLLLESEKNIKKKKYSKKKILIETSPSIMSCLIYVS